jgi:hypothetical protein
VREDVRASSAVRKVVDGTGAVEKVVVVVNEVRRVPTNWPQRGTKSGPPGCSGVAQACHKLGSGSAQAKLSFAHLRLRLKQQPLRSKDGNENCSCRDSDSNILFHLFSGPRWSLLPSCYRHDRKIGGISLSILTHPEICRDIRIVIGRLLPHRT